MLRAIRDAGRALGWAVRERQGWVTSWLLRSKLRALTLPLDRRRADGASRPPVGITLRLTMRCNLRCRMCHVVHSQDDTAQRLRETRDIPTDLALRLMDEIAEINAYVSLSGGEPLMHQDIGAVVRRASERGVVAMMATNGTLLAERADELVAGGLKLCSISLLGPPDIHNESACVPDAFERLREGVYALEEARKRHGTVTPVTAINCPITDLNAGRLVEVADVVADWPVSVLHFQHMWFKPAEAVALQERCHGGLLEEGAFGEMGDADQTTVDVEALADEVDALLGRSRKRPILVYPHLSRKNIRRYYHEPLTHLGPKQALCLWLFTTVHPNGEVSPCEGFNAGTLDGQSLMEIWNGEPMRDFRRQLRDAGSLPICGRCCVLFRRY